MPDTARAGCFTGRTAIQSPVRSARLWLWETTTPWTMFSLTGTCICDGFVRQSVTGEKWEGWEKCECTPCKKCETFFDGEGLSPNAIPVPDSYENLCLECSAREPRPKTYKGGPSQAFLEFMLKYRSPSYESARGTLFDQCTHCDGIIRHFPSGKTYLEEEKCECRPCAICRRWWNPSISQRCDKCTESDLESKSESEAGAWR